jgi:hypothetical protein
LVPREHSDAWIASSWVALPGRRLGWAADTDVTTRRLPEDILAEEEEHADDTVGLLGRDGNSS